MKKIAIIVLTLTRGGAERVVANLCNDRLVGDYDVTIITCLNKPVGQRLDDRITHICLEEHEGITYRNMADRFLKRRAKLRKVLDEVSPDALLCFMPEPSMLALSLKGRYYFPMIISVRNDPAHEYANRAYHMMMKWLYPKADGYVFQTEEAKSYFGFCKHIVETGTVIPNPLSSEYMNCEYVPVSDRNKVIISAAKLEKQKNQLLLLEAWGRLSGQYPDYELHIHGNGSLRDALLARASELGIDDRVVITENVPDLKDRLSHCSLFVLSSDYEGMPNVLMEAMAVGAPCISTDCPCGGPGFLMQDEEDGLLVPVGDVDAMTEAMKRILDDQVAGGWKLSGQLSHNAMKISERLNATDINDRWVKYIESIRTI